MSQIAIWGLSEHTQWIYFKQSTMSMSLEWMTTICARQIGEQANIKPKWLFILEKKERKKQNRTTVGQGRTTSSQTIHKIASGVYQVVKRCKRVESSSG